MSLNIVGQFVITEDKRLRKILNRLPADCTEQLKGGIFSAGNELYQAMVQRVPVRSGRLRESIGLASANNGLTTYVGFSKDRFPKQWKLSGQFAHFTEFGTKGYKRGDTREHIGKLHVQSLGKGLGRRAYRGKSYNVIVKRSHAATRAQPFIFPALMDKGPDIIETLKDSLEVALTQASGQS